MPNTYPGCLAESRKRDSSQAGLAWGIQTSASGLSKVGEAEE